LVKENKYTEASDISEALMALDDTGLLKESRIATCMNGLWRHYVQMERYFARKSITKASIIEKYHLKRLSNAY
jgi:sulfur transfer protein SufE